MPAIGLRTTIVVFSEKFQYNIPSCRFSSCGPSFRNLAVAFVPDKNHWLTILMCPCFMPSEPFLKIIEIFYELIDTIIKLLFVLVVYRPFNA